MKIFFGQIKTYFLSNSFSLFCINLLAIAAASFIPASINLDPIIQNFFSKLTNYYYIGVLSLLLLLLILSWNLAKSYIIRWINTLKSEGLRFVSLDYFIWFFLIFTILWLCRVKLSFICFLITSMIIGSVFFIISNANKKINKKQNNQLKTNPNSLSDDPLGKDDLDLLDREPFVANLYNLITAVTSPTAYVFGLSGDWGEGKTSVLNLLKRKFENNHNFLITDFDPWYFKTQDEILNGLYKSVEQVINDQFIFPGFKKTIKKYQQNVSPEFSLFGLKIKFAADEDTLDKIKERIEFYIERTKKKILIIIDDLDRLPSEELHFVLKLVRLNAGFRNTIFLLSYSDRAVGRYLEELNLDKTYLEKIIQNPIPLPSIEPYVLDKFLISRIESFLIEHSTEENRVELFRKQFRNIYPTLLRRHFKNLRTIKRYLNSVLPTLAVLKDEVDISDFLVLEVIRINFVKIYNDIWQNRWSYLDADDEIFFSSPLRQLSFDKTKQKDLKKDHINTLLEGVRERAEILRILGFLFPEIDSLFSTYSTRRFNPVDAISQTKMISNPEAFKKYFLLKTPIATISNSEIEKIISGWNGSKVEGVEDLINNDLIKIKSEGKLIPFFKNLVGAYLEKVKSEVALPVIRVIYKDPFKFAGSMPSKEWYDMSFQGIWTELGWALLLTGHLINTKVESNNIQPILEDIIFKTPSIAFAAYFFEQCIPSTEKKYQHIFNNQDFSKLKEKALDRLVQVFQKEGKSLFDLEDFDEKREVLLMWDYLAESDADRLKFKEYINTEVQNKSNFLFILDFYRKGDAYGGSVYEIKSLEKKYDLAEFERLARQFQSSFLSDKDKKHIESFLSSIQNSKENNGQVGEDINGTNGD
ncbi:MAG: P-loop NTPase fold protein [Acidobacteriota bacterium]